MPRRVLRASVPAALLLLGGCALFPAHESLRRMPVNSYLADSRDLMAVRRVVVLPVAGDHVPEELRAHLQHSVETAIAATQRFQVVPLPAVVDRDRELLESEARGQLRTEGLVDLAKRYQIDGVVLCRVHTFQPYRPPVLGMQSQLVSIHSGDCVWAADATYDSATENVRSDMKEYYRHVLAPVDSLHDWELLQLSPRLYGQYVVHRLVATLEGPAGPGR